MNYINTLREGDNITDIYFCKSKVVAQSKAGKTYYSLMLQDKTGVIDGKIWDLSNAIEHFEAMDYIKVSGQITSFNNSLQFNIKRVQRMQENEVDISDYMPVSSYDIEEMYSSLKGFIDSVKDNNLKKLLYSFFVEDNDFIKRFKKHSAAKSVHHGFIGGLLEHTLSVTRICDFFSKNYPMLDRDLLITAAICHDIGKIYEISDFPQNDYTDEGNLLGHIVMGTMMVRDRANAIEGFPHLLLGELEHCILAHHGKLEFGSPKKPGLMEAMALAYADDTDAKMESFKELLLANPDNNEWLGFQKLFDSNVRRTI